MIPYFHEGLRLYLGEASTGTATSRSARATAPYVDPLLDTRTRRSAMSHAATPHHAARRLGAPSVLIAALGVLLAAPAAANGYSHGFHIGRHHGHHPGHHGGHSLGHHLRRHVGHHGHLRYRHYVGPARVYPYAHESYLYGHSSRLHRPYPYAYQPSYPSGHGARPGTYYEETPVDPHPTAGEGRQAARGGGWTLLGDGRPAYALRAFSVEAQRHPTRGLPKVGYALASAELGEFSRGAGAMRRALRIDAEALRYAPVDDRLRPRIRRLIERYESAPERAGRHEDALFMTASLHYLLDEIPAAADAIGQAVEIGDQTSSTARLRSLIDEARASGADSDGRSEPVGGRAATR